MQGCGGAKTIGSLQFDNRNPVDLADMEERIAGLDDINDPVVRRATRHQGTDGNGGNADPGGSLSRQRGSGFTGCDERRIRTRYRRFIQIGSYRDIRYQKCGSCQRWFVGKWSGTPKLTWQSAIATVMTIKQPQHSGHTQDQHNTTEQNRQDDLLYDWLSK